MKPVEFSPSVKLDKFVLRLPDGMRETLRALSRENERSMNAEIVFHLKNAIFDEGDQEKDRQGGNPDGLEQSQPCQERI